MSNWQAGYVSDIEYTAQYYRELSPEFLNTVCMIHGYQAPNIEGEFTYCELGCGQGITTLMLAAMYPKGRFYAVDFNPSHIANAERIAHEAGLKNIHFSDGSFKDIAEQGNWLPDCDYIVYHGIYSWVSAENRAYLQEITGRHLKPGGLVYNSYNALPGWATQQPIQHFLRSLANTQTGRSDQRIAYARKALNDFMAAEPAVAKSVPQLVSKLKELEDKPVNYLVHEYLHDSWKAFYASEVIEDAAQQKLSYVGQANPISAYESITVPEVFREWLNALPSDRERQDFLDAVLNTQFRRDIYLKGATKVPVLKQMQYFRELEMQLHVLPKDIPKKVNAPIGELNCNEEIYGPVQTLICEGGHSIGELAEKTGQKLLTVIEVCMVMMSAGVVYPLSKATKPQAARRINQTVAALSRYAPTGQYLCASNSGMGIGANHLHCIYLDGYFQGVKKVDELGSYAYHIMQNNGFKYVPKGVEVSDPDELLKAMQEQAKVWFDVVRPIWMKLGIV